MSQAKVNVQFQVLAWVAVVLTVSQVSWLHSPSWVLSEGSFWRVFYIVLLLLNTIIPSVLSVFAAIKLGTSSGKIFAFATFACWIISTVLWQVSGMIRWHDNAGDFLALLGFKATTTPWNQWVNLAGTVSGLIWLFLGASVGSRVTQMKHADFAHASASNYSQLAGQTPAAPAPVQQVNVNLPKRFCPQCGSQSTATNQVFCGSCGARL